MAIDDAFREHKIEIAFPQQDVYVRSLPQSFLERLAESHSSPAADQPAAIPLQVASETTGLRKQAA
jgi:small-conductance mechanosensitive channel